MSRSVLDRLAELIDAAEVVDDYVTGVVGLAGGRLGGDGAEQPSRLARWVSPAASFGAAYGPEQLRKAAVEARHMVTVLDELKTTGEQADLIARLDELGLGGLPEELSAVDPASPELRDLQQRLNRSLAALRETRTKLRLAR